MYIKVLTGDQARAESTDTIRNIPTEILVNPDCPIKIIHDFLRKTFEVDPNIEVDLCDENGNLCFMYEKEPWMNGLNSLVPKSTYYLVFFEKEDNRISNPVLYPPDSLKKSPALFNEIMAKIRKQISPVVGSKPSRMNKTRSGSSYIK